MNTSNLLLWRILPSPPYEVDQIFWGAEIKLGALFFFFQFLQVCVLCCYF